MDSLYALLALLCVVIVCAFLLSLTGATLYAFVHVLQKLKCTEQDDRRKNTVERVEEDLNHLTEEFDSLRLSLLNLRAQYLRTKDLVEKYMKVFDDVKLVMKEKDCVREAQPSCPSKAPADSCCGRPENCEAAR